MRGEAVTAALQMVVKEDEGMVGLTAPSTPRDLRGPSRAEGELAARDGASGDHAELGLTQCRINTPRKQRHLS